MMATGNIQKRKRKNGYAWEITVETPPDPVTKKRNRTSKTVRGTKKEAEQIMRQMIADISDQCNSHERENIDMLLGMFQILSTCDIGTEK